ncbi:hypothetical protein K438DRAFT_1956350 [Mycena galopus ATCC 62051]|nr:hypothetical protein K438DRAFT_1956350 [Mycena galopus ATCC 62051]
MSPHVLVSSASLSKEPVCGVHSAVNVSVIIIGVTRRGSLLLLTRGEVVDGINSPTAWKDQIRFDADEVDEVIVDWSWSDDNFGTETDSDGDTETVSSRHDPSVTDVEPVDVHLNGVGLPPLCLFRLPALFMPFYDTLYAHLCSFYAPSAHSHHSLFTCGAKNFLVTFHYTSALQAVALFGTSLKRFPATLGVLP